MTEKKPQLLYKSLKISRQTAEDIDQFVTSSGSGIVVDKLDEIDVLWKGNAHKYALYSLGFEHGLRHAYAQLDNVFRKKSKGESCKIN